MLVFHFIWLQMWSCDWGDIADENYCLTMWWFNFALNVECDFEMFCQRWTEVKNWEAEQLTATATCVCVIQKLHGRSCDKFYFVHNVLWTENCGRDECFIFYLYFWVTRNHQSHVALTCFLILQASVILQLYSRWFLVNCRQTKHWSHIYTDSHTHSVCGFKILQRAEWCGMFVNNITDT